MLELKPGDALTTKYEVLDRAAKWLDLFSAFVPTQAERTMINGLLADITGETVEFVNGYLDEKLKHL